MKVFSANIQKYQALGLDINKSLVRLSVLRLVVFVFSVALVVYLANERMSILLWIITPLCILSFSYLLKLHNLLAYDKRHADFKKELNENEILRLENKLSGFPTGQTFINRDHPYIADLDIFGPHSLFQLLNRTTTESGNVCLAEWLSAPASKEVILERQEAIQELAPKMAWRQDFQASGMHFKNPKSDFKKLLMWIQGPVQLLPNQSKYLIACIVLSILSTWSAAYALLSYNIIPVIFILLVNYFLLKKVAPIAEEIIDNTHQNIKILGGYQSLITHIESRKFYSAILLQLQSDFRQSNYSAADEIKQLRKILEIFQLRGTKKTDKNKFYPIFNLFWLLDIYWIIQTEKWKTKNKAHLKAWASAVGEFEVLSSLAGFNYSNPSFTFPGFSDKPCTIHFTSLGHPLISPKSRVCNDFHLEGSGQIAMITGSNMAGKSTFLRTVGTNLVLALMGAPCCAHSAQVSEIIIFSSMRTQDNLEEGISSFYAELKRIEQLLQLIENRHPVFFLLDEMFKGTNSKDRHKGGFSLIKQLEELNAFGIISTHDLDLAILAGKHQLVSNYSFNSEIQEDEMTFDYKLSPGLCRDFNASELMKRSGIIILSEMDGL